MITSDCPLSSTQDPYPLAMYVSSFARALNGRQQIYDLSCGEYVSQRIAGAPRTRPDWTWNNPTAAAEAFVADNPNFAIEEPTFPFNEGAVTDRVTYWQRGFIKRLS